MGGAWTPESLHREVLITDQKHLAMNYHRFIKSIEPILTNTNSIGAHLSSAQVFSQIHGQVRPIPACACALSLFQIIRRFCIAKFVQMGLSLGRIFCNINLIYKSILAHLDMRKTLLGGHLNQQCYTTRARYSRQNEQKLQVPGQEEVSTDPPGMEQQVTLCLCCVLCTHVVRSPEIVCMNKN